MSHWSAILTQTMLIVVQVTPCIVKATAYVLIYLETCLRHSLSHYNTRQGGQNEYIVYNWAFDVLAAVHALSCHHQDSKSVQNHHCFMMSPAMPQARRHMLVRASHDWAEVDNSVQTFQQQISTQILPATPCMTQSVRQNWPQCLIKQPGAHRAEQSPLTWSRSMVHCSSGDS